MAELFFLRQLLRSPSTTAVKTQAFFKTHLHGFSFVAVKEVNEHSTKNNGGYDGGSRAKPQGKWVTLPPFTPTVNAVIVGERISRRSMNEESIETTSSALKWVLRCCPHLPRSLVQKLFRLRQVRRECLEDVDPGADAKELRLKRVGAKDFMKKGERIFLPISVQGLPAKKQEFRCSEEEVHFIRSLELYKDSAIIAINKPPKLPVQGGSGIKRSLDELAATCLKYDFKEPPRLT